MITFLLGIGSNYAFFQQSIIKLILNKLLPFTLSALPGDTLLNPEERKLRTINYLVDWAVDIMMVFTFGLASGFLMILILFKVFFVELTYHLQFGSYLQDKSRAAKDHDEKTYIYFELSKCLFYNRLHCKFLNISWFSILIIILLFWTIIMFDMIANYYSSAAAIAAVCFFWAVSLLGFFDSQLESTTKFASSFYIKICLKSEVTNDNNHINTASAANDNKKTKERGIELSNARLSALENL